MLSKLSVIMSLWPQNVIFYNTTLLAAELYVTRLWRTNEAVNTDSEYC